MIEEMRGQERKGGREREIDESLTEMWREKLCWRSLALKLFYLMVLRGIDGQ